MKKFVSREKLSKKAKRALDSSRRQSWSISPVTRKGRDAKAYTREKTRYRADDDGIGSFYAV